MLRKKVQPVTEWLKRVLTQPRSQLTDWQRTVRFAYDLSRYGARQLREDRATQMAAALAFRTLFALVPVMIVFSVMYKGMQGLHKLNELVRDLVEGAGLQDVVLTPAHENAEPEPDTATSLGDWIEGITQHIAEMDLQTLGWIGLAVMIYAAIEMMVTIEKCFNTVYRAPEGRPWVRRLPIYWTVITMSPLAIGLIMFVDGRVSGWLEEVSAWGWLIYTMGGVWSIAMLWLLFLGLYMLLPNTSVAWRPAMIGALVAAVLVQAGRAGLGAYVEHAITLRQIYGVIGLLPIFMLWVYVMWLVILFGLEVAATLQMLGGRRQIEEMEQRRRQQSGLVEPAAVLLVMEQIARAFNDSRPISLRQIADDASLPETTVAAMIDRLVMSGLVHRLDRDEAMVTLACPPEQISGDRLIQVGYELVDQRGEGPKSALLDRLRDSQREMAGELTLASLIAQKPSDQVSAAS